MCCSETRSHAWVGQVEKELKKLQRANKRLAKQMVKNFKAMSQRLEAAAKKSSATQDRLHNAKLVRCALRSRNGAHPWPPQSPAPQRTRPEQRKKTFAVEKSASASRLIPLEKGKRTQRRQRYAERPRSAAGRKPGQAWKDFSGESYRQKQLAQRTENTPVRMEEAYSLMVDLIKSTDFSSDARHLPSGRRQHEAPHPSAPKPSAVPAAAPAATSDVWATRAPAPQVSTQAMPAAPVRVDTSPSPPSHGSRLADRRALLRGRSVGASAASKRRRWVVLRCTLRCLLTLCDFCSQTWAWTDSQQQLLKGRKWNARYATVAVRFGDSLSNILVFDCSNRKIAHSPAPAPRKFIDLNSVDQHIETILSRRAQSVDR